MNPSHISANRTENLFLQVYGKTGLSNYQAKWYPAKVFRSINFPLRFSKMETDANRIEIRDDFHLQAIATDMDGSFFGERLSVSDSTLKAYRRAVQMGIHVFPATGRVLAGVERALKSAGAADFNVYPGVYLNGCTTFGPGGAGDIVWERHVPNHIVEKMVAFEKRVNERIMSEPNWQENPLIKNAVPEHGFKAVKDNSLKPMFITLGGYSLGEVIFPENNQLADGLGQFSEGETK